MKLAFYYHIPILIKDDKLYMPSYLGVFVDSLASYSKVLFIVMHTANERESLECDYELRANNIRHINLGPKTPAWHRAIFHRKVLSNALKPLDECTALIVRSPSPLAPVFHKYLSENCKLFFMIVGDYLEGADHLKTSTYRDKIIYQFLRFNDFYFTKQIKRTNVLVNSVALYNKYRPIAKSIELIKTTTLSVDDFSIRTDTCQKNEVKILYTGRIDPAKGLFELIEAFEIISNSYTNVSLHIVGWEQDSINRPVEKQLLSRAKRLHIERKITFHGRKSVGPELNQMYSNSDIYVIPSYHEGFPRTIWEAMANSLPVIATEVGGIPEMLTNDENAILIKPRSVQAIVNAIDRMIKNSEIRKKIIANGLTLAKNNTLEIQTLNIINCIKKHLHDEKI